MRPIKWKKWHQDYKFAIKKEVWMCWKIPLFKMMLKLLFFTYFSNSALEKISKLLVLVKLTLKLSQTTKNLLYYDFSPGFTLRGQCLRTWDDKGPSSLDLSQAVKIIVAWLSLLVMRFGAKLLVGSYIRICLGWEDIVGELIRRIHAVSVTARARTGPASGQC